MSGRFSPGERDRRWGAARGLLRELALDCLVTAPGRGRPQPDSIYLGGWVADSRPIACILPLDGPCLTVCEGTVAAAEDLWGTLVAAERNALGSTIVRQMQELGVSTRRVGVTGLSGAPAAPDGTMPGQVMAALKDAFPDAQWVDVTEGLRDLRMIKSGEEIAVLESATALVDRAVDRVAETVRPGMTDLAAWSEMVGELVRGGSQPPASSRWGSGLRPLILDRPPHAELQRGSILLLEPEANVAGYHARSVQPVALESCDAIFRDLCAVQAEYWQACFELLAPGKPIAKLYAECAAIAKQLAARPGRYEKLQSGLVLVGCGLGLDAPSLTTPSSDGTSERLCSGWVFELLAPIGLDIGPRVLTASWSDVVAVGPDGVRRLGHRAPGLLVIS